MKINVISTQIGPATLSDEHSQSSYGQMVLVDGDGNVYGPGDVTGYLHADESTSYTPEQIAKLQELMIDAWSLPAGQRWSFGATAQALVDMPKVIAEAEKRTGRKVIRNR